MAGSLQAGGKKRPVPAAEAIAARVARFKGVPRTAEGVVPLNPGFFKLEQMRSACAVKQKAEKRAKVRQG